MIMLFLNCDAAIFFLIFIFDKSKKNQLEHLILFICFLTYFNFLFSVLCFPFMFSIISVFNFMSLTNSLHLKKIR